jgi:hypothetical protein
MSDFQKEFGFIPSELLDKCHEVVKEFHERHGSSGEFAAASAMFTRKSPHLTDVVNKAVSLKKTLKLLGFMALTVNILSMLTSWWLLTAMTLITLAAIFVHKQISDRLLLQRSVILSVEVLAVDFAGWGTLFPSACLIAKRMSARLPGDWPMLIDLYLPPERRIDAEIAELFVPSISLAQSPHSSERSRYLSIASALQPPASSPTLGAARPEQEILLQVKEG